MGIRVTPNTYTTVNNAAALATPTLVFNSNALNSTNSVNGFSTQNVNLNAGVTVERNNQSQTSNGVQNPQPLRLINPQQIVKTELQKKYDALVKGLKDEKAQQGFIGQSWDWFKNKTGWFTGSNKVQTEIDALKTQLKDLNEHPEKAGEIYKNLTGKNLDAKELQNISKGNINLKAEELLKDYKEGQKESVDIAADVISGIVSVGIYAGAIALCPFTGGASIAVGVAAAAAAGASIKSVVKLADAGYGGRQYDSFQHDLATGSFSGVLAPISGGVGGAVGKTIVTRIGERLGIQALKHTGEEIAEQGIKSLFLNPMGYKYIGKASLIPFLAEVETSGAVFGTIDNAYRAELDGQNVADAAKDGFTGGLVGGLILGPAAKGLGKATEGVFRLFRRERIIVHTENVELAAGDTHETNIGAHPSASTTVTVEGQQAIDLSSEQMQGRIKTLGEGQSFDVGGEGGQPQLRISRTNGRIRVTNMSERTMSVEERTRLDLNKASDINFLYGKIQKQLQNATKEEIEAAITKIMEKMKAEGINATREEVLLVMDKLTRYANYKSLNELVENFEKAGITDVYCDEGTSLNSVLRYLMRKGHLKLSRRNGKKAYILDDAGLKYLEELKKKDPEAFNLFMQNLKAQNVEFVVLDGFNNGINMFNADVDIAGASTQVLKDAKALMKKNPSLTLEQAIDEVMNKPTMDRANALGITPTRIKTTNTNIPTVDKVTAQLGYGGIQKQTLEKIIDKIAKDTYPDDPQKIARAKKLLTAYLSVQIDVYSPKRLAQVCKKLHKLIEEAVTKKGKSMDDVYFVVPNTYKSYVYVAYQYAVANGIDPSRIISASDTQRIPKGAVIVVLDDVVGSGSSMVGSIYSLKDDAKENKQTIIAASLISTKSGKARVSEMVGKHNFIVDDEQVITPLEETDFYKKLSASDKEMLKTLIGYTGFCNNALVIRFPYMRPDNNSHAGDSVLGYFHNRVSNRNQNTVEQ